MDERRWTISVCESCGVPAEVNAELGRTYPVDECGSDRGCVPSYNANDLPVPGVLEVEVMPVEVTDEMVERALRAFIGSDEVEWAGERDRIRAALTAALGVKADG
jgi:hypothetical protein